MELNSTQPILIPAKTAVLLFFMPSAASRESIDLRIGLTKLVAPLQQQLGESVRILKIDETMHPDVVRSFDVRHFPAFVLVQQGVELWRQEGTFTTEEVLSVSNLIKRMANR